MRDPDGAGTAEHARDAATRGDWRLALDLFLTADVDGQLDPADLPQLADVAYAVGISMWPLRRGSAFLRTCVEADDPVAAAGAAARVAMHLLLNTALMAPVRGWLARAEQLLEGHAPTSAHAWHAVVRTYERTLVGDPESARSWADVRSSLVRRSTGLRAPSDGLRRRGFTSWTGVSRKVWHCWTRSESQPSGDLDPLSTGSSHCELVCALQALGQYDSAEEWTEVMEWWCRTNSIGSLHGRCRVHRAEILRLRGALDEAESEAIAASDELRPYLRRELGWPLTELGRIRLHSGDITGAEHALVAAHHAGWDPYPSLALVRLAQGDVTTAAASIRDALERPPAGALEGAPPEQRPATGTAARGSGRDRDRGRRHRSGPISGRRTLEPSPIGIRARRSRRARCLREDGCGSPRAMRWRPDSTSPQLRDTGRRSARRTRRRSRAQVLSKLTSPRGTSPRPPWSLTPSA